MNKNSLKKKDIYDKKLLEMAKKYRMNTDTRRNIFCILFTAEVHDDNIIDACVFQMAMNIFRNGVWN